MSLDVLLLTKVYFYSYFKISSKSNSLTSASIAFSSASTASESIVEYFSFYLSVELITIIFLGMVTIHLEKSYPTAINILPVFLAMPQTLDFTLLSMLLFALYV